MAKKQVTKKPLTNKLVLVAVLLLLIIIGLLLVSTTPPSSKFSVVRLYSKPALSGQFIKNPDIMHSSSGWLSATPENLASKTPRILDVYSYWKGDGYVIEIIEKASGDKRSGVVVLHPINQSVGRYIEQSVSLPDGYTSYKLNFGVSNVADTVGFEGECADVGIIVTIKSLSNVDIIFNDIVRHDRWYDYSVDLGNEFNRNDITVRIESYAADAGCGAWNAEFAAVDYVDIVSK